MTEVGAVSNNDYIEFTLSASPTYSLDLTNVTLNYGYTNTGVPVFNDTFFVRSSVDSYATNLAPGLITAAVPGGTAGGTTPLFATFDLSAAAYDNLSTITFRLYQYDDLDETTSLTRFDNITVNGDVVPEPSTLAMLLGGVGLLTLIRRRR